MKNICRSFMTFWSAVALPLLLSSCTAPGPAHSKLDFDYAWPAYGAGDPATSICAQGLYIAKDRFDGNPVDLFGIIRQSDGSLEILVPLQYKEIIPLSSEFAIGRRNRDSGETLNLIDIRTGKERPLPVPPGFQNATVDWLSYIELPW